MSGLSVEILVVVATLRARAGESASADGASASAASRHATMAGARRIPGDSSGCGTGRPAACQSGKVDRRRLVAGLALLAGLAVAPAAHAEGRPSDASGTVCTYRVPEAPPYDTPEGQVRVHYVADPADPDSPALSATRVGGVPDWIVETGQAAETAWARETALGFPAPPP